MNNGDDGGFFAFLAAIVFILFILFEGGIAIKSMFGPSGDELAKSLNQAKAGNKTIVCGRGDNKIAVEADNYRIEVGTIFVKRHLLKDKSYELDECKW